MFTIPSPLVKITAHLCIQVLSTYDDPNYFRTNLGTVVHNWKQGQLSSGWDVQQLSRNELLTALQGLGLSKSEANEVHQLLCVHFKIPPF